MKKRHMRGIISVMLCVAMVLSLLTVSSVEASEQAKHRTGTGICSRRQTKRDNTGNAENCSWV